jgi:hypothetical protein
MFLYKPLLIRDLLVLYSLVINIRYLLPNIILKCIFFKLTLNSNNIYVFTGTIDSVNGALGKQIFIDI